MPYVSELMHLDLADPIPRHAHRTSDHNTHEGIDHEPCPENNNESNEHVVEQSRRLASLMSTRRAHEHAKTGPGKEDG